MCFKIFRCGAYAILIKTLGDTIVLAFGKLASGCRTTATATTTSPQNITLNYGKCLAVRPSRSRRTMWAKYAKMNWYEWFQS